MINRFLPIVIPVLTLIGWEVIINKPQFFLPAFLSLAAVLFLLLLKLIGFRIKHKDSWLLLAPPFLFAVFLTVFFLFLNSIILQQVLAVLAAILIYLYLRHLYNFLFQITRYSPMALESFSSYFNIISFLFLSISAYGLINFLNLKIYYLALIVVISAFILSYQFFWINKIDEQHNLFASILMSILTVEFFWSMSFFPISHFITGLALAIVYYVVINLTLLHFLEKLDKRLIKIYISVGVFCLLAILLSAKWL